MFDPTIGQWLSEDPKGFEAGDENLRRYVGNGPTNATDPSGLFSVNPAEGVAKTDNKNPKPTIQKGSVGAGNKSGLIGTDYTFVRQAGDQPVMIQKVELWGHFTIWDACGRSYSVSWEEGYLEAWSWTRNSFKDIHMAGPSKPAKYLEAVVGFDYKTRFFEKEAYLVFNDGEEADVVQWKFYMEATFTMGNANSVNLIPNAGSSFLGVIPDPGFRITNLITPEGASAGIQDSSFSQMLMPKGKRGIPPLHPLVGKNAVSHDVWEFKWTSGDPHAQASYRGGYKMEK